MDVVTVISAFLPTRVPAGPMVHHVFLVIHLKLMPASMEAACVVGDRLVVQVSIAPAEFAYAIQRVVQMDAASATRV